VSQKLELALTILKTFQDEGILEDIMLIGSWSHFFYRHYFDDSPEIPTVRTLDIDFLIPNPRRIRKEVDIHEVLKKLDFASRVDRMSGLIKFSHPDLELEFLSPLLGKGEDIALPVDKLKTNAIGLRFLNLLPAHPLEISYKELKVKVPEPAAYVLHKFIISVRRLKEEKRKKDRESAVKIGEFLLKQSSQQEKLRYVYGDMPAKWRSKVLDGVETVFPSLFHFLKSE
jgi:hypothetical protein